MTNDLGLDSGSKATLGRNTNNMYFVSYRIFLTANKYALSETWITSKTGRIRKYSLFRG